jgi:hypothetical protein
MAEIRVQRKKGIPLIWLLLGLILLALASWALVEYMGDDETASLATPERQVLVAGPAVGAPCTAIVSPPPPETRGLSARSGCDSDRSDPWRAYAGA